MKSFRTFCMSLCLTALVLAGLGLNFAATASGNKKTAKELTACEKEDLKYQPQIKAFNRAFNSTPIFKPLPAYQDIQRSESIKLARLKFGQLSPEKRKAVWKAKLSQVDVDDFNPIQREFFERSLTYLDSLKFDGTDDAQTRNAYILEGRNLFTRSQFVELFMTLKSTVGIMKASAQTLPECECNWSTPGGMDDFCNWSHGMNWKCAMPTPCVRHIGCGYYWMAWCDGMCQL